MAQQSCGRVSANNFVKPFLAKADSLHRFIKFRLIYWIENLFIIVCLGSVCS